MVILSYGALNICICYEKKDKTVMVYNSTNIIINKLNNHLPLSLNTIKNNANIVGNQGLSLDQAHKCGGVKLNSGIPTLPSW